jgi:hypothetical protein
MDFKMAWVLGVVSLAFGCSSGDDDGDGAGSCGKLAENYYSYGECLNGGGCAVTQNGCSFTLTCEDGAIYTGEVDGKDPALVDFGNDDTSCSGQLVPSNKSLTLSCVGSTGSSQCDSFELECEDGGACSSGG